MVKLNLETIDDSEDLYCPIYNDLCRKTKCV